jgi:hypothetical protein
MLESDNEFLTRNLAGEIQRPLDDQFKGFRTPIVIFHETRDISIKHHVLGSLQVVCGPISLERFYFNIKISVSKL